MRFQKWLIILFDSHWHWYIQTVAYLIVKRKNEHRVNAIIARSRALTFAKHHALPLKGKVQGKIPGDEPREKSQVKSQGKFGICK